MAILETWTGLVLLVLFNGAVCLVLPRLLSLPWGQIFSGRAEQPSCELEIHSASPDVEDEVTSIRVIHS